MGASSLVALRAQTQSGRAALGPNAARRATPMLADSHPQSLALQYAQMINPATAPLPKMSIRAPHAAAAAAAKTDLVGGRQGKISTETLPNGVRLIIADRPGAKNVKIQVGIGAGSLQDPQGKLGLAHLLEHLAFEGSPTRSSVKQEKLRDEMGGNWNAYTDRDSVVYYGVVPTKDAVRGASLLTDMFKNPAVTGKRVPQELAAVKNEMIYSDGSMQGELWHVMDRMVHGEGPLTNNVIGTRKSVDAITSKDLRAYHSSYFTGRNTVALVEGDKKHLPLDVLRKELGALESGARVDHSGESAPKIPGRAVQIIADKKHKAVDITVGIPITAETLAGLDKGRVKLVTRSLSNELHSVLRRDHHLTYGAAAKLEMDEIGSGGLLTLQASVAPSVARQAMKDLVSVATDARDGFGVERLKVDKKMTASRVAMTDAEPPAQAISNGAEGAFQAALQSPGVEFPKAQSARAATLAANKAARKAQAITLDQFAKTASRMIDLKNIKVLAFGDVDQADILGGLKDAGIGRAGMDINPVDLSMYRDMGIGV